MERRCSDCALKALKDGMCPIFNADMTDKEGCPYYTQTLETCDVCGQVIIGNSIVEEENEVWHTLCVKCGHDSSCRTCANNKDCHFITDQGCSEPPYVITQTRQGNMIIQSRILNPMRAEATCTHCPCYNQEGLKEGYFCFRADENCSNYKTEWRN